MKNYRYGEFNPRDYCVSWIAIVVFLLFSIGSIVLKLSFLFAVFPLICAIIRMWIILAPHREKFILYDNSIIVFFCKQTRRISLPAELTLVVSYADVCPPLTLRTAIGNQTHILKGKFAVSILQKMPLDVAVETLHRNQIRKYTTSIVQRVFDECLYIYSFVCDQSQIDRLIAEHKCLLIIPESLREKVSVDKSVVDIYVDSES